MPNLFCSICKRYDEISDKVSIIPTTTKELVETQAFLQQVRLIICLKFTLKHTIIFICDFSVIFVTKLRN